MNKFKKGDKVRVIDAEQGILARTQWKFLGSEGDVHVVAKDQTGGTVSLEGMAYYFSATRFEPVPEAPANTFELRGYTESGMYVDHRFVSGPDEAKEYIEGTHCRETAVHYKLFEHVPVGEFKVSSVTVRTVAQV